MWRSASPSVGGPCESGAMTKEVQITFDCADPAGLAAFWAEVLGYQVQPPPDGFDSWDAALESFGVPRDQWNSRSAILPRRGLASARLLPACPRGQVRQEPAPPRCPCGAGPRK